MTRTKEEVMEDYHLFRGRCQEMCAREMEKDKSLALVRGHYFCPAWGTNEPHWWLKRRDGTIFDPSARQFPSNGAGTYQEFDGWFCCESCGKEIQESDVVPAGPYPCCSQACALRLVGL